MKITTHEELLDKHIGTKDTINRKVFETKLTLHSLALSLKNVRKERNITQAKLAEMIGKDKTQISKIEHGTRNITVETILQIADALGVEIALNIKMNRETYTM